MLASETKADFGDVLDKHSFMASITLADAFIKPAAVPHPWID